MSTCARPRAWTVRSAASSCQPSIAASTGASAAAVVDLVVEREPVDEFEHDMRRPARALPSAYMRGSAGCGLPASAATSRRSVRRARGWSSWCGRGNLTTAGAQSAGDQASQVSQRWPTPSRSQARLPPGSSSPSR